MSRSKNKKRPPIILKFTKIPKDELPSKRKKIKKICNNIDNTGKVKATGKKATKVTSSKKKNIETSKKVTNGKFLKENV